MRLPHPLRWGTDRPNQERNRRAGIAPNRPADLFLASYPVPHSGRLGSVGLATLYAHFRSIVPARTLHPRKPGQFVEMPVTAEQDQVVLQHQGRDP